MNPATLARCVVAITAWLAITRTQIGTVEGLPDETFAALRSVGDLVEEMAAEDEGCAEALHALRREPQARGAQAGLSEQLGLLLQEEPRLQAELVHRLTLAGTVQSQDGVVRIVICHPARPGGVLFTFELEFVSTVTARLTPPPRPFFRTVPDVEDALDAFEEAPDLPLVMALTGPSGIGKTAYARELADRLADRATSGVQVEVSAAGPDAPVRDAAEIVHDVLVSLGVRPDAIPRTLAARTALVRDKTAGRRPFFLVEDCTDFDLVRQLLPAGRSAAVVTTDADVQGPGVRLKFDRLDAFEAANLLNLPLPRHEDSRVVAELGAAADRLLRLCEGLPLSLRLLRSHIASCSARMLSRVADQLTDAAEGHAEAGAAQPVFAALDLCFPEPLTRGYRVLAVAALLAAPVYDLRLLAAACAEPDERTAEVVEDLLARGLLEPYGRSGGRWQLHPLIARYARERIGPLTEELTTLLDRALRVYLARLRAFAVLLGDGHRPDPIIAAWARNMIADDLPVVARAARLFGPALSASVRSLAEQLLERFRAEERPPVLPELEVMPTGGAEERSGDGERGAEPPSAHEPSKSAQHERSRPHERSEAGEPGEAAANTGEPRETANTGETGEAQEADKAGRSGSGEADDSNRDGASDDPPRFPGGGGSGRGGGNGPERPRSPQVSPRSKSQGGSGGSGGADSSAPRSPVHAAITKAEGERTASPRNPTLFGADRDEP